MLHMVSTMFFLSAGMFSLAVIAAMLIDYQPAIQRALGLRAELPPLPAAARVRVVRTQRLLQPSSAGRYRAAA